MYGGNGSARARQPCIAWSAFWQRPCRVAHTGPTFIAWTKSSSEPLPPTSSITSSVTYRQMVLPACSGRKKCAAMPSFQVRKSIYSHGSRAVSEEKPTCDALKEIERAAVDDDQ